LTQHRQSAVIIVRCTQFVLFSLLLVYLSCQVSGYLSHLGALTFNHYVLT